MTDRQHYHLIGIGGAGMSGLARALHSRGARVTGSDMAASPTVEALETELGERLAIGHAAANIGAPDLVVASAAIKDENPEIAEARLRGIEVVSRAAMLGRLMDSFSIRIAVTGTHGKTTTSAMAAQMLADAGLDPTALIGADLPAWRSNTRIGRSEIVVAEACEAFGSFLEMRPTHAIVTNIEADHLDHYGDFDSVVAAFRRFAQQTRDQVIVCADGGADRLIDAAAGPKMTTYGLDCGQLRAEIEGAGRFSVRKGGELVGAAQLRVPGRHNVLNALSVVALGLSLDVPFDRIARGIETFAGTSRRFELLGEMPGGITLIDDYAHHPTEIRATLAAARGAFPGRRIVALFQPHLPSRTRDLMEEFADSFADADIALFTDIYLAREVALPGITSELLARKTATKLASDRAVYAGDVDEAATVLQHSVRDGDVVLTMGAGNVRRAGEDLLRSLSVQKQTVPCHP